MSRNTHFERHLQVEQSYRNLYRLRYPRSSLERPSKFLVLVGRPRLVWAGFPICGRLLFVGTLGLLVEVSLFPKEMLAPMLT